MSLNCTRVPVQYREYENGLFTLNRIPFHCSFVSQSVGSCQNLQVATNKVGRSAPGQRESSDFAPPQELESFEIRLMIKYRPMEAYTSVRSENCCNRI